MKHSVLILALASVFMLLVTIPVSGQEPEAGIGASSSHEESFESIVSVMEGFEGRSGVSLMKLGKLAMSMGKTVGRAGGEWTRKVAKAFRRVSTVYMLDYGESSPIIREEIESAVTSKVIKDNLILRNGAGNSIFDETYGETSSDGKHVSDLIIIMYDQSIVAIKGTVLSTDVERIVRRLNKQL
ncbi:MAG: hypothetical protein IKI00_03175 [Bacteroidales bacterium]|nr:hypothetical protein [Bacteroidales bacterium]